jgi:glycosyltransferase involved in cell wall biosynthesis
LNKGNNKSIYINASNCHQGGGKTLLDSFISGIENSNDNFFLYIDTRYNPPKNHSLNIVFIKITIWERIFISQRIKKHAGNEDVVIYFGNLPPILKFNKVKVILLLSNRFYVDSISYKGFTFRDMLKIKLEKIYFNLFKSNVNEFVVQTTTMKNLLQRNINNTKVILTLPFENSLLIDDFTQEKEANTFIYVASLLPYKNHKRLIQAWIKLKNEGISPKLFLTIDQNNEIGNWIKFNIVEYNLNVILLERISRSELMNIYRKCEFLIYPSYFEAYGLPLVEATNHNLKLLTADIDYCWDLVTPYDFFNPYDASSIERCVKRAIKFYPKKTNILKPKEFINKII